MIKNGKEMLTALDSLNGVSAAISANTLATNTATLDLAKQFNAYAIATSQFSMANAIATPESKASLASYIAANDANGAAAKLHLINGGSSVGVAAGLVANQPTTLPTNISSTVVDAAAAAQVASNAAAAIAAQKQAVIDAAAAMESARIAAEVSAKRVKDKAAALSDWMAKEAVANSGNGTEFSAPYGSQNEANAAKAYYDSLPSFAVGTPFVTHDQTANIHQGEIIIDPQSSSVLRKYGIGITGGGNNAELIIEIRAVREELAQLRADTRAGDVQIASNTGKVAKIIDRWEGNGMPAVRAA
jgi:hypothetical protein